MAGKLVESLARGVRPRGLRGHLPRGGPRPDRAQGQGRGDRPPRGAEPERGARRPDRRAAGEPGLRSAMPRPLWTGSLCFGLVNVPVSLHERRARPRPALPPAAREGRRADRAAPLLLQGGRGGRRGRRSAAATSSTTASRSCSPTRSSPRSQPRKTRTIDIEAFVDARRRRPDLLRPPLLPAAVRRERGHPARLPLLVEVMESTDRAALGRFVMRTKEYLVLVRAARRRAVADDDAASHDEVRPTDEIAARRAQAGQEEGRPGGGGDRGAGRRLGPGALQGLLPQAPRAGRQGQEEGQDDQGARGARSSPSRAPGPDGGAGGDAGPKAR